MQAILRESTVGLFVNHVTKGRLLPFPEQREDFVVPDRYRPKSAQEKQALHLSSTSSPKKAASSTLPSEAISPPGATAGNASSEQNSHNDEHLTASQNSSRTLTPNATRCHTPTPAEPSRADSDNATLNERDSGKAAGEKKPALTDAEAAAALEQGVDPNLVDWYGPEDPDNPQNWTRAKKGLLLFQVMLLTFSVYIGSAIFTPSISGVQEQFGVSQTKALLGLSLYVLGYGLGPMILSPLTEIPSIGRLYVYQISLFIFVILQIPTALAPNYSTLMAMRFFAGFVCSPALSTGGATLTDTFHFLDVPLVTAIWSAGAVAGPVIGPVAGGFAAQEENWRWPLYMLLFLSLFCFIVLSFLFPETSHATILLRRAQRLRKLTGNKDLRSKSELDQAAMSSSEIMTNALLTPFRLLLEPMVAFLDIYIGLVYAVFYLWFESFPLVFNGIYQFNLGEAGLPFVGFIIALAPTLAIYYWYQKNVVIAKFKKTGILVPEDRLKVALVGAAIIPAALLIFGWTSRESVHWIAPVIGASLYLPGIYLVFQGAIVYLPMAYQSKAASVLAGNALIRGVVASIFPLFGHALFVNLGIGPGSSLLAGLAIIMVPPMYLLLKYGARLRTMSKFAQ